MKIKNIACIASIVLASLSVAKAANTVAAWTFDNLAIATNGSPQPSTGFGTASALGMGNSYNNTNSISNPDIQGLAGSSSGNTNSWRIRGNGAAPNGGNGWSTNAPIGTQGAKFAASTSGYYKIKVSFDVYATTDAEANLQVQYTTDGTIWNNAIITSAGTLGVITNNTATNGTVMGSYVILTNNGTTGWNNQITIDLTGISGVDNDANFAVRMVNASTGTNCVDTTAAVYNNTSGSWTFDNVVIQGVSFDTVTEWTFESEGTTAFVPHPVPEFGSGLATSIGFDFPTNFVFSDGSRGSTNKPDILANGVPYSSSSSAGQFVWRVRGQGPGNGWNTAAPIGSQGAEFDVSTVNYNDVLISFDMFSTSQGEAKMCVLYTTNNWTTTNNASTLAYGSNPTFIVTNPPSGPNHSDDTVVGTYFWQTTGQNFYNNFIVDFTGVPGVANNPNFAIRIVNAAQGADCLAYNGGSYNNSSGNWRYDNVAVNGTYTGLTSPTITNALNATVDNPFTNTFADDPSWRAAITGVYLNGSLLTNTAYAITAGQIVFIPTNSVLLQISGVENIVIFATGYNNAKVTQLLAAGVGKKLVIAQPSAPSASGGTLIANPAFSITDQFGNGTTNPYANVIVAAAVGGSGGWTLGGSTIQAAVNGFAIFTNLSATVNGSTAVSGAVIAFTVTGFTNSANHTMTTNINSSSFNIGAPPAPFTAGNLAAIQIDTVSNNTTFSMIEIKPSAAKQTSPINIVPISATAGTNSLRLSSAGSCGKLALSDDGTLVTFVGFQDGSSATPDETFNLNRAVGTLNYTNKFSSPVSYVSSSLGGSQGRSACTPDDVNYIIADKGGLYLNTFYYFNQNNVTVKTFGGTPYVQTQKTAAGSPISALYGLNVDFADPPSTTPIVNNLPTDPVAQDFYIVSTNNGDNSVLYVLDQVSSTLGIINKYLLANDGSGNWIANGSFTNGNGGDTLFTTTNGNGGVYLYYTTGGGGTAGNSIVRLTDSSITNSLNITSSNVIYTASATTSVEGLTFVPQKTAYATELIPPPILTAQTAAPVSSPFTITNTPDDPTWRSNITAITVNGSPLPLAAYSTNQSSKIVFDPSQSALLQSSGLKTIVISATGYSTNSIAQTLTFGSATKLVVTTQPTAPAANGGTLVVQPVVKVEDTYGNVITNNSANITATAVQGSWALGGNATIAAVSGTGTFTNLTAFSPNNVVGATISFASGGLVGVTNSPGFNIFAPLGVRVSSGGNLTYIFTNTPDLTFSILATNNITAPLASWPVIGTITNNPTGSGRYQFIDPNPATNAQMYYILSH
jgi:hypothetical protein